MASPFKAIVVSRGEDKKQSVAVSDLTDDDLMDGDVLARGPDHRAHRGGEARARVLGDHEERSPAAERVTERESS